MNNDIIGTETESLISTRKIEIWNWEKLRDLRIENKKPWFCKLSYGFLFVSLSIKKVQFHPEKKTMKNIFFWSLIAFLSHWFHLSSQKLIFSPKPMKTFQIPCLFFHSSQKFHQMRSKNSIFNRNNKTYYSVN